MREQSMSDSELAKRVRHIRDLVRELDDELLIIARSPRKARNLLSMVVPGPMAGRVSSLLAALYHETHLRAWLAGQAMCEALHTDG